jgi:hypothetical protein
VYPLAAFVEIGGLVLTESMFPQCGKPPQRM